MIAWSGLISYKNKKIPKVENKIYPKWRIDQVEWFKKIDVYLSNAWWEGFSVSLLEAMAAECYPLAHFWRGVEELLPQENIYVSNNELKNKILAYYSLDLAEREKKRKKARQRLVNQYGNRQQINEIINLIDRMAETKKPTLHVK